MISLRHKLLTLLLASAVVIGVSAVAAAQTLVVVQVRTAAGAAGEARVTLTPQTGSPHSCQTRGGTCQIPGVPPGTYVVTAQPLGSGEAPIPRTVPVPPSTEVAIHVTLR